MRRKWNQPFYDEDPNCIEVFPDGTVRRGIRATYCDEDVEMFQQGYKCVNCEEVLDSAFPESCFLCGFPVKEKQIEVFGQVFDGWRPMGSQIDWDEEQDRLERQRDERLRAEGAKARGIWVPSKPS